MFIVFVVVSQAFFCFPKEMNKNANIIRQNEISFFAEHIKPIQRTLLQKHTMGNRNRPQHRYSHSHCRGILFDERRVVLFAAQE